MQVFVELHLIEDMLELWKVWIMDTKLDQKSMYDQVTYGRWPQQVAPITHTKTNNEDLCDWYNMIIM